MLVTVPGADVYGVAKILRGLLIASSSNPTRPGLLLSTGSRQGLAGWGVVVWTASPRSPCFHRHANPTRAPCLPHEPSSLSDAQMSLRCGRLCYFLISHSPQRFTLPLGFQLLRKGAVPPPGGPPWCCWRVGAGTSNRGLRGPGWRWALTGCVCGSSGGRRRAGCVGGRGEGRHLWRLAGGASPCICSRPVVGPLRGVKGNIPTCHPFFQQTGPEHRQVWRISLRRG